jgi:hypothetical protein
MYPTYLGEGDNFAGRGKLYRPRPRAILAEREVRSCVVMILKIARQDATQVMLVEDDDVIQALAAATR